MRIMNATKQRQIKWRYIDDYMKYYKDNIELNDYIDILSRTKNLNNNCSFFAKKEDTYLVILSYEEKKIKGLESADNKENCELIGIPHKNAELIRIPAYIDGGIEELRNQVIYYINTINEGYGYDINDMFDLLDTFADCAIGNGIFGEFEE